MYTTAKIISVSHYACNDTIVRCRTIYTNAKSENNALGLKD